MQHAPPRPSIWEELFNLKFMMTIKQAFRAEDVVYLAGPMTGVMDHNRPLFQQVQHLVISQTGAAVISPADLPTDLEWHEYMRRDVKSVCEASCILCLPKWWDSKGANVEHYVAQIIRVRTFYLTSDLQLVHQSPVLL